MAYHTRKKKDSLTILKAVLVSAFTVITAVCSYFFYVIPGIKKAEENSWKYAEVHLTEPRIAISGVGYGNAPSETLNWVFVDSGIILNNANSTLELQNADKAFLIPEKTALTDTSDNHVLTLEETEDLFAGLCSGKEAEFKLTDPEELAAYAPKDFTIDVTGRYQGTIALTRDGSYPADKTDIVQVMEANKKLPVLAIIEAFGMTLIMLFGLISMAKKERKSRKAIVVITVMFILFIVFMYATRNLTFHRPR